MAIPVEVLIRTRRDGREVVEPIENWMRYARTGQPLPLQNWVFAGSRQRADEGITADSEGTVVAIVDFHSSLIALPERHSESNADLWLAPHTDRIPPAGTRCELILRPGPLLIRLLPDGSLFLGDQPQEAEALHSAILAALKEWPGQTIRIESPSGSSQTSRSALNRLLLEELRVPRDQIVWHESPASSTADK